MAISGNEFSAFLASRRSTRSFLPTPVKNELIDELITDAMTAPSWSNTRPFLIAVASGEQRDRISADLLRRWDALSKARTGNILDKIKLFVGGYGVPRPNFKMLKPYPKVLQPRATKVGKELYGLLGVKRGDKKARDEQWANNYKFFGAPTVAFVFIHKGLGVFAANDLGLFAENLMLSAHARGLGTCAQGALGLWPSAITREFQIPPGYKLVYGIAIGYPSEDKVNGFQAERLDIQEIKVK
jgi:nitroreductase